MSEPGTITRFRQAVEKWPTIRDTVSDYERGVGDTQVGVMRSCVDYFDRGTITEAEAKAVMGCLFFDTRPLSPEGLAKVQRQYAERYGEHAP